MTDSSLNTLSEATIPLLAIYLINNQQKLDTYVKVYKTQTGNDLKVN